MMDPLGVAGDLRAHYAVREAVRGGAADAAVTLKPRGGKTDAAVAANAKDLRMDAMGVRALSLQGTVGDLMGRPALAA